MSDDELMQACRRGAREPFKEIWSRYEGLVTNFTQKILGDHTMAEEATHNTFIALWRVRERYEPRDRFRAYVLKLAYVEAREERKRRSRFWGRLLPSTDDTDCTEHVSPQTADGAVLDDERRRVVSKALSKLHATQREAIVMRYYGEMTHAEIAAALDKPPGTIRSLVCHAHRRLETLLHKHPLEAR